MSTNTIFPQNGDPYSEFLYSEIGDVENVKSRKVRMWSDFFFASNVPVLSLRFNDISAPDAPSLIFKAYRLKEDGYVRGINVLNLQGVEEAVWGEGLDKYQSYVSADKTFLPEGSLLVKRHSAGDDSVGKWCALRPEEQKYQNLSRVGVRQGAFVAAMPDVFNSASFQDKLHLVSSVYQMPSKQRKEMREFWGERSPYLKAHMRDLRVWKDMFPEKEKSSYTIEKQVQGSKIKAHEGAHLRAV